MSFINNNNLFVSASFFLPFLHSLTMLPPPPLTNDRPTDRPSGTQGKTAEAVAEVKRLKALENELGVRGHLQEVGIREID